MATVNEKLQSAEISHQVDLQQLSNAEVRKVIALLNRTDAELASRLSAAIDRMDGQTYTVAYMERLLASVRELSAQAFAAVSQALTADLLALGEYEQAYQLQLFENTVPAPALAVAPLTGVTLLQVRQIAYSRPFQGKLLSEWLDGIEESRAARIRDAIRVGMNSGQTTDQIVRGIMGIRSEGYADGLLNRTRNDIESMVRTAISHVAQGTRDQFYAANDDLMAGLKWLSTLDTRTSEECRIRDTLSYTSDYKPVGHSVPWLAGPGRLHYGCRSTSTPIITTWQELGLTPEEIGEADRASMDGQVPESMSYGDWLKNQSAARQDEVLGPTRGKLFREGGLSMDKFYNDKGRYLDLDELKDRDARAFEKAGIAA
ncbi:MAG: hypothetical protein V7756_09630 [Halopseudomonas sp.]|uniref:hypothetical protein n=1 Tax=Halopseudomonas sp. TaxID=2901191 RepID=UPI003003328C